MQRSVEVAKVLLKYGADCSILDWEKNCAAHVLQLTPSPTTVELFNLLVPNEDILSLTNAAGVSVLQRFASWATTAKDNRPYAPAMARRPWRASRSFGPRTQTRSWSWMR